MQCHNIFIWKEIPFMHGSLCYLHEMNNFQKTKKPKPKPNKTKQNSDRTNQNSTFWAPCGAAMTTFWHMTEADDTHIPALLEKCYSANVWTKEDVYLNAGSRHTRTGLRWFSNLSRQWYDWQVTHIANLAHIIYQMQVNINARGRSLWPLNAHLHKQDTSSSGSIRMRDKQSFWGWQLFLCVDIICLGTWGTHHNSRHDHGPVLHSRCFIWKQGLVLDQDQLISVIPVANLRTGHTWGQKGLQCYRVFTSYRSCHQICFWIWKMVVYMYKMSKCTMFYVQNALKKHKHQ